VVLLVHYINHRHGYDRAGKWRAYTEFEEGRLRERTQLERRVWKKGYGPKGSLQQVTDRGLGRE
jgi:hypothetical protein